MAENFQRDLALLFTLGANQIHEVGHLVQLRIIGAEQDVVLLDARLGGWAVGHDLADQETLVLRNLHVVAHFGRHRPAEQADPILRQLRLLLATVRRRQMRRFNVAIRGANLNDLRIGLRFVILSLGNRPGAKHQPPSAHSTAPRN
jgi:hypothetical protein